MVSNGKRCFTFLLLDIDLPKPTLDAVDFVPLNILPDTVTLFILLDYFASLTVIHCLYFYIYQTFWNIFFLY